MTKAIAKTTKPTDTVSNRGPNKGVCLALMEKECKLIVKCHSASDISSGGSSNSFGGGNNSM